MTGDIYDAYLVVCAFVWDGEVGEAEFDSDATFFLFRESVWISACERLDEGGFSVVDVTCCAEDTVHYGVGMISVMRPFSKSNVVISSRTVSPSLTSSRRWAIFIWVWPMICLPFLSSTQNVRSSLRLITFPSVTIGASFIVLLG